MKPKIEIRPVSRKKFVFWTAAALSVLSVAKFFFRSGSKPDGRTIKMLTQDGKLVEVDVSKLSAKRKKVKDAEIHTWVQRKPSL